MKKHILKIGDNVELWNGSTGEITELEFPNIRISTKKEDRGTYHKICIKKVNGVVVSNSDVTF